MAGKIESAIAGLAACAKAAQFNADAMTRFRAACDRGDWLDAERERMNVIAATETYLAEMMSAYRAAAEPDED